MLMSSPAPYTTAARPPRYPVKWGLAPIQPPLERKTDVVGRSIGDRPEPLNLESRARLMERRYLDLVRLVTDIAASLVGVSPDDVDDKVVDGLRRIVEALPAAGAVIWRRDAGGTDPVPTHQWRQPNLPTPEIPSAGTVPWSMAQLDAGKPVVFLKTDQLPDPIDRAAFHRAGYASGVVLPLPVRASGPGELQALMCYSLSHEDWTPEVCESLRTVAAVIGQALDSQKAVSALGRALEDIRRLRERPDREPDQLHRKAWMTGASRLIVSESAAVSHALRQVEQVAPMPATVLLLGETGSGKEVFARTIHDLSPRRQRAMVTVNCAAMPGALIESELFGREKGAYTGAFSQQIGRFEAANQSTLLLDEIGELSAEAQVKLLRVLQERTIERLGSNRSIKVDVRIIAATNRNLEEAVKARTFREDLYYRLNVFPIVVPPLRERIEDVPGLVWAFVDEFSTAFGKPIKSIARESMRNLQAYGWPGNVRELRNVIERAVIVATGPQLEVSVPAAKSRLPEAATTLADLDIRHISAVLELTNWRVRGPGGAADRLGIKPTTLESRMARLGLRRRTA
jgi:formate hydrogenlyase transcriptional activator